MKSNLVSIIISTFNRANWILHCLKSIQMQSYSNFECLIIDDHSEDETKVLVQEFIKNDSRFNYFMRESNYAKGISGCRNMGLDLALGDYILFADDDDLLHPFLVNINLQSFLQNRIDFNVFEKKSFTRDLPVYNNQELILDHPITHHQILDVLNYTIPISSCTIMLSKNCIENIRFSERLDYAEDWEFFSKVLSKKFFGMKIKNCLYFNRKHENSNTSLFYSNKSQKRHSKSLAIVMIYKNLKNQELMNFMIKKYLINFSLSFPEYNTFEQIINEIPEKHEKVFWEIFRVMHPLRLILKRLLRSRELPLNFIRNID